MAVKVNILSNIKETYCTAYPTDDCGKEINPKLTFAHAFAGMAEKKDFYNIIGVNDSLVRERVFAMMATAGNVTYNDVYNLWMADV